MLNQRLDSFKQTFNNQKEFINNPLCWHVWKRCWNYLYQKYSEIIIERDQLKEKLQKLESNKL